jgi:hypothetical protein
MGCVDSHESGIVNRESDERGLHQYASSLAGGYQIHHLPCRSEQFPGTIPPETLGDGILVSWKRRLVEWTNRFTAPERKKRQVGSMEHNQGEKIHHMHKHIGR